MLSLNKTNTLNINLKIPCFQGKKSVMEKQWDSFQITDKILHLNQRETAVIEKVKETELKHYAENGFHLPMTKENIEQMIQSSGGYYCDGKIIFHVMKSFYDYDRAMEMTLEIEKEHNNYADPLKEKLREKNGKKEETIMAAKQNLINLTPAATIIEE